LVLFREEDKVNKIKNNRKNIIDYLKGQDLWDKKIYNDEMFDENLNEIKKINIQINQILNIVEIKEEDFSDVQDHVKTKYKQALHEDNGNKKEDSYANENDDSDDDIEKDRD
jgi:hypothetical protein